MITFSFEDRHNIPLFWDFIFETNKVLSFIELSNKIVSFRNSFCVDLNYYFYILYANTILHFRRVTIENHIWYNSDIISPGYFISWFNACFNIFILFSGGSTKDTIPQISTQFLWSFRVSYCVLSPFLLFVSMF